MDKRRYYDGEQPTILGPEKSLQRVQKKLENLENQRSLGCEAIKQRKREVFEKASKVWADLDRIQSKQDVVPNLALATSISVCVFGIFQLAKAGFDLARWSWQRKKPPVKEERETQISGTSNEWDDLDELGVYEATIAPRRLHARDWNI